MTAFRILFSTRTIFANNTWHSFATAADQIIIVLIKTTDFLPHVDDFVGLLSSTEKIHALKIPIPDVQRRYIIQKGWQRLLWSELLSCSVDTIEFGVAQFGKPFLKNPSDNNDWHFNISHSNNFALYAFAKNFHVGIDIEEIPTQSKDVSEAIFLATTASEKKALDALSPHRQTLAFLKLWTRKEALSKTLGLGLHMDFRDLEIGLCEQESFRFFASRHINLVDISSPGLFFATLGLVKKNTP